MGHPCTADFVKLLNMNGLPNSPVTSNDVQMAKKIFGPDVGAPKGITTCQRPLIVESLISPVASGILKQYHMITLCVDIVYINHNPLLVSISQNIKFGTVEAIMNNKTPMLMNGINDIKHWHFNCDYPCDCPCDCSLTF